MKKISCVGYHATGSGAVDDFLREFDNIETARYGIESRFLQDPDGIADLEYNLIENPHRLNSGFALKRFLLFAKAEEHSYRHIFGKKWMDWANGYVQALASFAYKGYWHGDFRIMSPAKLFIYKVRRVINFGMPAKFRKNKYYNYFPGLETYCVDLSQDAFLQITQQKCEELCALLNRNGKEYVVLDQAVSPQNPQRYLRYISDMKVVIVDRDPRDVYLNDIVKNKDFVLPKDVDQFCTVFRMSRRNAEGQQDSENVLRINFEDMIYRYEETTQKVMSFLGLKEANHVNVKAFFNPNVSIKNTRLWEKDPAWQEIADRISERLPEYLYHYEE